MEVALSQSWLLLGLACALVSVNKLKIKLRTKLEFQAEATSNAARFSM